MLMTDEALSKWGLGDAGEVSYQGVDLVSRFRHLIATLIHYNSSHMPLSQFQMHSGHQRALTDPMREIDGLFVSMITKARAIGHSEVDCDVDEVFKVLVMLKHMLTVIPNESLVTHKRCVRTMSELRLKLYHTVFQCLEALECNDKLSLVSISDGQEASISLVDVVFVDEEARRDLCVIEDTERRQRSKTTTCISSSSSSTLLDHIDREGRRLTLLAMQLLLKRIQSRFDQLMEKGMRSSHIVANVHVFKLDENDENNDGNNYGDFEQHVWRQTLKRMNDTGVFWQCLELVIGQCRGDQAPTVTFKNKHISLKPTLELGRSAPNDMLYWWLVKGLVTLEGVDLRSQSAKAYDKICKRLKQLLVVVGSKSEADLCALIQVLAVIKTHLGFSKTVISIITDFFNRHLGKSKLFKEPMFFSLPRSIEELQRGLNDVVRISTSLPDGFVSANGDVVQFDDFFLAFKAFLRFVFGNKEDNKTITVFKTTQDRLCSTLSIEDSNVKLHRSVSLLLTLLKCSLNLNVDTKSIVDAFDKLSSLLLSGSEQSSDSVLLVTNSLALCSLKTMDAEGSCVTRGDDFIKIFKRFLTDLSPNRTSRSDKCLFIACYQSYCDLFDNAWTRIRSKDIIVEKSELFCVETLSSTILYLKCKSQQHSGLLRRLMSLFVGIITKLRRRLSALRTLSVDNLTVEKNEQLMRLERSEHELMSLSDRVLREMVMSSTGNGDSSVPSSEIAHFISALFTLKLDHGRHKNSERYGDFTSGDNLFPTSLIGTLVFIMTEVRVSYRVSAYFLRDLLENNDMSSDSNAMVRKLVIKGWLRFLVLSAINGESEYEDNHSENEVDDDDLSLLRLLTTEVSQMPEMSSLHEAFFNEAKFWDALELLEHFIVALGSLREKYRDDSSALDRIRRLFHPFVNVFVVNLEYHKDEKKESRLIRWHRLSGLMFEKCFWLLYSGGGGLLDNLALKLLNLTTQTSDQVTHKCFMLTEKDLRKLSYSLPHYIRALATIASGDKFGKEALRDLIKVYFNRFPIKKSHPFLPLMVDEECGHKVKRQVLVMLKEHHLLQNNNNIVPMIGFVQCLLSQLPSSSSSSTVSVVAEVLLEALLNARRAFNEKRHEANVIDDCLKQLFDLKKTINDDRLNVICESQLASFVRNNVKYHLRGTLIVLKVVETLDESYTSKLKLMPELSEAHLQMMQLDSQVPKRQRLS